jgi:hypothetical protein
MDGAFRRDLLRDSRSAFNIIRIDLVSIDSGVSYRSYNEQGTPNDPNDDTITLENFRDTRLGYIFSGSWAHCWMEESSWTGDKLLKVLNRFAPDWDYLVVVLNDNGYGGCARGTRLAVTLGVNWDTVAHEFGHIIGGLDDEYDRAGNAFTGSSWSGPNCSNTTNRTDLKWADLVASTTPLPTQPVPPGWNSNTDVGAFEGCGSFQTGLFRPVLICRMRDNAPPFCPVCSRVIRQILAGFL